MELALCLLPEEVKMVSLNQLGFELVAYILILVVMVSSFIWTLRKKKYGVALALALAIGTFIAIVFFLKK